MTTEPPDPPPADRPPVTQYGAAVIRVACIAAVAALGVFDLRTPDEAVPAIVYGTLIGILATTQRKKQ